MYKAPSIQRPRDVYDYQGRRLGQTDGFRPDPGTGGLGIELELDEEGRKLLDTDRTHMWLSTDKVMAVRRERVVLDAALRELRLIVRERSRWDEIELSPTDTVQTEG